MGLNWNAEGVKKHADEFLADVNTLNGIFTELKQATNKLSGGWNGDDANDYGNSFKVSEKNFDDIIGECNQYEKFLNEIVNEGYTDEETELANAVSEAYLS